MPNYIVDLDVKDANGNKAAFDQIQLLLKHPYEVQATLGCSPNKQSPYRIEYELFDPNDTMFLILKDDTGEKEFNLPKIPYARLTIRDGKMEEDLAATPSPSRPSCP
jgi:hypothetical protein